eukprot:956492_1
MDSNVCMLITYCLQILARCRIHNEANANKVNNQVHANKRRMQTSDFKGAVLAWAERSVLDGTCKTLKKYRNFLQTNGYLMKYQYDNISDRFKQFEDIRVWLNDWNGSGYSKYRIQFCQNVYLPPAAILKIRTKYQRTTKDNDTKRKILVLETSVSQIYRKIIKHKQRETQFGWNDSIVLQWKIRQTQHISLQHYAIKRIRYISNVQII